MKRILLLILCAALVLSGCAKKDNTEPTIPQMAPEATTQTMPEAAPEVVPEETEAVVEELEMNELLCVSVPATSDTYALEDGTELFTYTAQHMQLLLPDATVSDKVILDFLNRVDSGRGDADHILNAAKENYDPNSTWYPYFYQTIYSPTRIDHGVLSLFGTQNSYSGAHHGSLNCVAVNYDLSTGDVLTLGSIMHMDANKEDFITLITEKLEANAEEYQLFDNFEDGVRTRLNVDENLYEDFFFTSTGLSFFFSPYEIAPYSAGIITTEIPYNELPGLLYDGYFPAEREMVQGTLHTGSFMETDMEQFNNMAEVDLASGEEIMVIYPEGDVEDVKITLASDNINMPEYTVFAALKMSEENAVVLSLREADVENVNITYLSENELQAIPLS